MNEEKNVEVQDFEWKSADPFQYNRVFLKKIYKKEGKTGKMIFTFIMTPLEVHGADDLVFSATQMTDGGFFSAVKQNIEKMVRCHYDSYSSKNLLNMIGDKSKYFYVLMKMDGQYMNIQDVKKNISEEDIQEAKMSAEIQKAQAEAVQAEDEELPF